MAGYGVLKLQKNYFVGSPCGTHHKTDRLLCVRVCVCDQELKTGAADARHRVDELLGLSQSMLSIVKDSPTKSGIKEKLQRLHTSLQHIDSELGASTIC